MSDSTVLSLHATAVLDRSGHGVDAARRRAEAGDEDEGWIVAELAAGRMLPASLIVVAKVADDGGAEHRIDCLNRGLWIERRAPPLAEQDVADITPKDFDDIAARLRGEGVDIASADLAGMYVHVELDEPLRAALLEHVRH